MISQPLHKPSAQALAGFRIKDLASDRLYPRMENVVARK
jgi:hypothetical protein